eukprot:203918_1
MKLHTTIGYVLTAIDTFGDYAFAVDAYIIINTIKEGYSYGEKIYEYSDVNELQVAKIAIITFCALGALIMLTTACVYACCMSKEDVYDSDEAEKGAVLIIYNWATWGLVDVPIIIIVLFFSFKTETILWTAIISLAGDILIWLYKGWSIFNYTGEHGDTVDYLRGHCSETFYSWICCFDVFGVIAVGIGSLVLGLIYLHDLFGLAVFAIVFGALNVIAFSLFIIWLCCCDEC